MLEKWHKSSFYSKIKDKEAGLFIKQVPITSELKVLPICGPTYCKWDLLYLKQYCIQNSHVNLGIVNGYRTRRK